jgi:hypothetical protein
MISFFTGKMKISDFETSNFWELLRPRSSCEVVRIKEILAWNSLIYIARPSLCTVLEDCPERSQPWPPLWGPFFSFRVTQIAPHPKRITLRDSLQKLITLHKARSVLRLVQNACRNWGITLGVTQRGPKYAQKP